MDDEDHRPPTPEEQANILRAPLHVFAIVGVGWLIAAFLFGAFNLIYASDLALGLRVFVTLLLAGLATAQVAYLLIELRGRSEPTRLARPAG